MLPSLVKVLDKLSLYRHEDFCVIVMAFIYNKRSRLLSYLLMMRHVSLTDETIMLFLDCDLF